MAVDSILCPLNQLENQPFEEIHVCHGGRAAKTVPATVFPGGGVCESFSYSDWVTKSYSASPTYCSHICA